MAMGSKRIDFSELPSSEFGSNALSAGTGNSEKGVPRPNLGRIPGKKNFVPPEPSAFLHVNAYERHKHFINTYVINYVRPSNGELATVSKQWKTDSDLLREEHRFVWQPEDDEGSTWERRLAKRYYDQLFKEYALADLGRYKENKIALRWRTQQEVLDGKGQFVCGSIKCAERRSLQSWEVNFAYKERGEVRRVLVKVRLCAADSARLNYRSQKRKAKRLAKENRRTTYSEAGSTPTARTCDKAGENAATTDTAPLPSRVGDDNVWRQADVSTDTVTQDESFDAYFEDMFL